MRNKSAQIQTQGQQMLQTQGLSPLQMMIARLLQLTTVEMEERVRGELNDNPALEPTPQDEMSDTDDGYDEGGNESEEELIIGDYRSEDDIPDYKLNGLTVKDLDFIVMPFDSLGCIPVLEMNKLQKNIFVIAENKTVLNVTADKLNIKCRIIKNYQELIDTI